VEEIKNINY